MVTPIDLDAYARELTAAIRQTEAQLIGLRAQLDLVALMRERAATEEAARALDSAAAARAPADAGAA